MRGRAMTIVWNESEDDWQTRYGISDELADEMADHQDYGFHSLEYGPANEAVRSFLWLVEQWNRIAGPRDEETMVQRAFLARAFAADGQVRLAADELRRLADDRAALLGDDHPQTLRTRGQLGQVLARGGFPDEGIEVLEPLLADRLRLHGPDGLPTFDSMGNLAEAYLLAGRRVEGRDLYAELLERRTRVLGDEHDDTIRTRLNLIAARAQTNANPAEAVGELHAAIEQFTEMVGPLHDATLTARGHLADAMLRTGDLRSTIGILEDLLSDRLTLLGPDHPDSRRSKRMLDDVARWSQEDVGDFDGDGPATGI